ncbi:hypothetical protein KY285_036384 [Solanum tuberosum]|nr:hypothetical protein KY285_036384 [Solanum tuberosum]
MLIRIYIFSELAPYTISQSFVARLRQNRAKNDILIDLATPIITTKQGLPTRATTTHTNQQPNQEKANEISDEQSQVQKTKNYRQNQHTMGIPGSPQEKTGQDQQYQLKAQSGINQQTRRTRKPSS